MHDASRFRFPTTGHNLGATHAPNDALYEDRIWRALLRRKSGKRHLSRAWRRFAGFRQLHTARPPLCESLN